MTDFIEVVEHNPIVFVKAITEAIAEGYVVQNSNAGYPLFGAYGNAMRLFKEERVGTMILSSGFKGQVEHYDPMGFMLILEAAVLAGYRFKDGGKHSFDEKGLKSIELEIPQEAPVEEEKPAKRKPAKKALAAEPTKSQMEENE